MLDPATRGDPAALESLLADTFVEFGSSGCIFTREQVIAELQDESSTPLSLTDFAVTPLAADAALATYRSHRTQGPDGGAEALRSSLWVRRDGRWQMLFHQGTRVS